MAWWLSDPWFPGDGEAVVQAAGCHGVEHQTATRLQGGDRGPPLAAGELPLGVPVHRQVAAGAKSEGPSEAVRRSPGAL